MRGYTLIEANTRNPLETIMSRKHFIAIAAAIRENLDSTDNKEAITIMARAIADVCAGANGQFDRGRFLRACGV